MVPMEATSIVQYTGGIAASIFALIFLMQKFLTGWKSDSAETSVITLMHSELQRMSEQNTKLSIELGKLQDDLIALNKELRILTSENQRLHSEVVALTSEITNLRNTLK